VVPSHPVFIPASLNFGFLARRQRKTPRLKLGRSPAWYSHDTELGLLNCHVDAIVCYAAWRLPDIPERFA
jgi:hypothetical protein